MRVGRAPELSVGGEKERYRRDWWRCPRNDPSGVKSVSDGTGCVAPKLSVRGPGWLRLWGVAGSPSVDTLTKGDAPSSLELIVGADGDVVDWNALRGVTYSRRGGI